MTGYRDNQWYFPPEENLDNIGGYGGLVPQTNDNEPYLYPGISEFQQKLGIGSQSNTNFHRQTKGFIRSLNRIAGITDKDRRFFFQFNPPALMRNLVMNTDMLNPLLLTPGELTLPVPGQANFSFEIMLDRQMEVNRGLNGEGASGVNDLSGDAASAYEIGVLADINVLDKVIGVGVDPEAVATQLKRAQIQYANQASDASGGDQEKSAILSISAPEEKDDGTFEVTVTHSTKDFVADGTTVDIGGCLPIAYNTSGVTVSEVSNVTPYSFVYSYATNPGASATTVGSVIKTTTTTDGTTTAASTGFDIAQVTARLTSLGQESNRAFLIPNPVRVIFSSLYMVDGYITAVNLLFTKFSRNMIPVTATLSMQMEARYIGFAREKTFLTDVLEQAQEPGTEAPVTPNPNTIVNAKFSQLVNAVSGILNNYQILVCGTDNDDNPENWCSPDSDNFNIKNVLSFNTLLVQFGFKCAKKANKSEDRASDYLGDYSSGSSDSFMKYLAQGNIKSITHQIDSLELYRKTADPSETSPVTLLSIGPIVAPTSSSFEDFKKNGALGGSGANKNGAITDVKNTKLQSLIDGGMSSGDAKDKARSLYFANAIPNGLGEDDVELYVSASVTCVVTDNDGNSVTLKATLPGNYKIGNRKDYLNLRPAFRAPNSPLTTIIVG